VPFRNAQTHFEDILQSIDHIAEFLAGIDFEGYREDRKTRSAVERELQIITEAAIRLGDEAETLCPGPDWKGFRGMGNILRHVYHRVDDEIVEYGERGWHRCRQRFRMFSGRCRIANCINPIKHLSR
jgi:uncharacterized protein with HEPN domain